MPKFGEVVQVYVSSNRYNGRPYVLAFEVLMHGQDRRTLYQIDDPECQAMVASRWTEESVPPGVLADWIEEFPAKTGLPDNLIGRVAAFIRRHGFSSIRARINQ